MAKRTTKTTATFFRVNESLAGNEIKAYTAAVFLLLGMLLPKSKGVRPNAISSFYNSATIIRHHKANGNFEKVDGKIRLTAKGRKHFMDRVSADVVDKKESTLIAKALRSGNAKDLPADWKGTVTLSEITISK